MTTRRPPIVVTGTDTGIGKTWLGCALAGRLVKEGRRVVAIKPVETGCADVPDDLEDGRALARATGQIEPTQALLRFQAPLTPALAAEMEGAQLDFDELVVVVERHIAQAEIALVEGAGGLLSPITWEWNVADLAQAIGAEVIVVAPDRLGTINHTLLTLGALELAGLPVLGVALIAPTLADASTGTNAAAIARLAGIDRVCTLPRAGDSSAALTAIEPVRAWLD